MTKVKFLKFRLYPEIKNDFEDLKAEYDLLGGKINNYIKWFEKFEIKEKKTLKKTYKFS